MAQYIVKQSTLEAIQFPGLSTDLESVIALTQFDDWCVEHFVDSAFKGRYKGSSFHIMTKDTELLVAVLNKGDYLIKNESGSLRVMEEGPFEKFYQKV